MNINTNLLNTYLGNKGYTLNKSELTLEQQTFLKQKLLITPVCHGGPVVNVNSFPVFRESPKKLYVPRYFGESMFGPPKESKIPEGQDITLEFQGSLRDYQQPIIDKLLNKYESFMFGGGCLLEVYCGWGKTDASLYVIGQLKKKTMIIVNKDFLMKQWIERINRYYPTARIGCIQGQIVDIDDKDIVMVMLQSLSKKEYPASVFESFGFAIFDEVHHLSAEGFSCALFKFVTKYTLGLSATMDRKDGTTNVFKMFLGEVIAKQVRPLTQEVIVRGILFKTDDEEFNKVETDFRGNTAVSKMLSKICTYNRRSEFIIQVLKDMLEENPKQQIMIIASYKNILKYIFNAINHQNICSVGYYIGGMKDSDLKISESKQVVLATYSMAAEGLDIKTLSTLFMVTPMTNIEQAVGRILRQKHDFPALIVDFVDPQANFVRQWSKRKSFYKKQNYKIIQQDSKKYSSTSTWRIIYSPICYENENNDQNIPSTKRFIQEADEDAEEEEEEEDEYEDEEEPSKKKQKSNIGVCLLKK
jgi:superfamily II DNA or RNA helicase